MCDSRGPELHSPHPHTYHVNELCDRQAEVDEDHIRDVGHRPGPLVVAREEFPQQPFLCVGPGLHVAARWGTGRHVAQEQVLSRLPAPASFQAALSHLASFQLLLVHASHLRTFAHTALQASGSPLPLL